MTRASAARAKTDKLDARTLASLLWKGELDAVWMPDERCRILRRRLARREQLLRARTRSKNEIQAVLQRRLQQSRRWLTCSGSKAANGSPAWSCPSRSASQSTRVCGTSRSWTLRSPRLTGGHTDPAFTLRVYAHDHAVRRSEERAQLKALVEGHDWAQTGHNTAESTSAAVERDTD